MKTEFEVISSPSSAADLFFAALPADAREERVFVLPLDANGRVLAKPILVSVGHEDGTAQIDIGAIFREALKAGAEEVIVAHNHPSGDPMPGKDDIRLTERLVEASRIIGIPLLDHLILGSPSTPDGSGFVSLRKIGAMGAYEPHRD